MVVYGNLPKTNDIVYLNYPIITLFYFGRCTLSLPDFVFPSFLLLLLLALECLSKKTSGISRKVIIF